MEKSISCNDDDTKKYKSKILSFSSNSSINLSQKSPPEFNEYAFKFSLPETIDNVIGIKLKRVEIPFTYNIITENNNTFSWVSYNSEASMNSNYFNFTITGDVNENGTQTEFIKNISNFSNIKVGMTVTNTTYIDTDTKIIEINENQNYLKLNKNTIGSAKTGESFTITSVCKYIKAKPSNNPTQGYSTYYSAKITPIGYYSSKEFGEKIAKIMSDTELTNNVNPINIYTIDSIEGMHQNNKLDFTEKKSDGTKILHTITISNNKYEIDDLLLEIKNKMNAASTFSFKYKLELDSDTSSSKYNKVGFSFASDTDTDTDITTVHFNTPPICQNCQITKDSDIIILNSVNNNLVVGLIVQGSTNFINSTKITKIEKMGGTGADKDEYKKITLSSSASVTNNSIELTFSYPSIYKNCKKILGFLNTDASFSYNGSPLLPVSYGDNNVLENRADQDPWNYGWYESDSNNNIDNYTSSFNPVTNRISIKKSIGGFAFYKYFYQKQSMNTIERCLGHSFPILPGYVQPSSDNAFKTTDY